MKNTGKQYLFGERKINQIVCTCKDCQNDYYCNDGQMVMLKDELWMSICDRNSDTICSSCIEKRMGRKISESDYKNIKTPCNQFHIKTCVGYQVGQGAGLKNQ